MAKRNSILVQVPSIQQSTLAVNKIHSKSNLNTLRKCQLDIEQFEESDESKKVKERKYLHIFFSLYFCFFAFKRLKTSN